MEKVRGRGRKSKASSKPRVLMTPNESAAANLFTELTKLNIDENTVRSWQNQYLSMPQLRVMNMKMFAAVLYYLLLLSLEKKSIGRWISFSMPDVDDFKNNEKLLEEVFNKADLIPPESSTTEEKTIFNLKLKATFIRYLRAITSF